MGLFDELLKKPNPTPATDSSGSTTGTQSSGGSSGNPPIVDPLADAVPAIKIEKSEEVAIATESALDTAAAEPPPVSTVAVDDISSILVSNIPASTEIDNIFVAPTEVSIQDNLENPVFTEPIDLPQTANDTSDLVVTSSITNNASIDPTELMELPSENITNLDNLFGSSGKSGESTPNMSETGDAIIDSATVSMPDLDNTNIANFHIDTYEHPTDFIQSSMVKIDQMIAKIDIAHNTKLEEALGYKTEKEKYTELEEQSYADAEKYVKEKEHALTMRAYFEEQGKIDATSQETVPMAVNTPSVASVETILTGLAVQSAVTETVQSEKKSKTTKKEEESMGILGL